MKSFIFTLCTAVVVARKAIKLGSGDAGSDIHASRKLGSGDAGSDIHASRTLAKQSVGRKLKVRLAHTAEGAADMGSNLEANKMTGRSHSFRDGNLMRRFKDEVSGVKSWKSWFETVHNRTAQDGEAIGFVSLDAATVSPAKRSVAGPAPGPAPVPNGPAPAPFDFDSMRNGPLPSQGFEGANVQHVDGDTLTRDWRREFGPKARHRDMFAICAEHPHNTWCARNGYISPLKPMADEIVEAKPHKPTTPSPLPATTEPAAKCPGGSLAACLDLCNEHIDMPSLELPPGMQPTSNLSSVDSHVKKPANVSFLGVPSQTKQLPDGMVPEDLPSVNAGSSKQRACNDECVDLCDSLPEGFPLPKGLLPKSDTPRMPISYTLLVVLVVSQLLTSAPGIPR